MKSVGIPEAKAHLSALARAANGPPSLPNAGYQTPASALGKDFVLEGEDVTREDVA
jgi:short subunit dehydrogenase-like uncharacterized protein